MKFFNLCLLCIAFAGVGSMPVCYAATPQISVTIKPLHSLVWAVAEGVTEPQLLLDGYNSPHLFTLKPSSVRSVHNADLVVWVGEGMESFIIGTLKGLSEPEKVLRLVGAEGLTLLPLREKGFHDHAHGHAHSASPITGANDPHTSDTDEHHDESADDQHDSEADIDRHDHDHDNGEAIAEAALDTHFWLNPDNAAVVVGVVAERLAKLDPENAAVYRANAVGAQVRLKQLSGEIELLLADSHDLPYLVFHDSFQYFEHRFNLASAGVVSVQPDARPSARRIRELQHTIASGKVKCLFSEPQFKSRSVSMLVENTDIGHAVIDPLGADFDSGPEMYFEWLAHTAKTFRDCFAR